MNNYKAIEHQWEPVDQQRYPHLFGLVVKMMSEGIKAGERIEK